MNNTYHSHTWADEEERYPARTPRKFQRHAKPAKQKPQQAIPCVVNCRLETQATYTPMVYRETMKCLVTPLRGEGVTIFPSHKKAHHAIWHTLDFIARDGDTKADGSEYHADDFEISNVQQR